MRGLALSAIALLSLSGGLSPAAAQDGGAQSRGAMLRELAGALGSVHYFVVACDGRANQYWRERMIALIEEEGGSDRFLRSAMIQAFNDRYREQQEQFPACDDGARVARRETAERGAALATRLAEPYR